MWRIEPGSILKIKERKNLMEIKDSQCQSTNDFNFLNLNMKVKQSLAINPRCVVEVDMDLVPDNKQQPPHSDSEPVNILVWLFKIVHDISGKCTKEIRIHCQTKSKHHIFPLIGPNKSAFV